MLMNLLSFLLKLSPFKCNIDSIGVSNVIGEDFPNLGASVPLTPAEELAADHAFAKVAALGAASLL